MNRKSFMPGRRINLWASQSRFSFDRVPEFPLQTRFGFQFSSKGGNSRVEIFLIIFIFFFSAKVPIEISIEQPQYS